MRSRALLLLVALCALSCMRSRSLPFSNPDAVTRIEVSNPDGAQPAQVITDPEHVARTVAALRVLDAGWQPAPVVLVAPVATAAFYRDTVLVGTLWLGRGYLMALVDAGARVRPARAAELVPLAEALGLPSKARLVPLPGTT